jgi:hypothetical protein
VPGRASLKSGEESPQSKALRASIIDRHKAVQSFVPALFHINEYVFTRSGGVILNTKGAKGAK